jgi:hypothetical protein
MRIKIGLRTGTGNVPRFLVFIMLLIFILIMLLVPLPFLFELAIK